MDEYYGRNTNGNNESGSGHSETSSSLYSYSYINKEPETQHTYEEGPKKKEPKERRPKGFKVTLAKCAALALVFGLIAGGVFSGVVHVTGANKGTTVTYGGSASKVASTATNTASTVTDVSDIVEEVMPSLVAITNTQETTVQNFFGQQVYETPTAGSGIIIGQDEEHLLLVTNNHVIADAKKLTVSFIDNETAPAEVKGTAAGSDLAVLTVKLKDIPEATLSAIKVAVMGSSKDLKVGESAIAIGNALGYGQSVSTGVISALDRSITIENVTSNLIQTDAAINPGNSGGALLNLKGEVIGINSAKYSDTKVEGIGYAIPIDTAEPIIENIVSREEIDESERAYLGIYGVDVSDEAAQVYNMPSGIYITKTVKGAGAEKAGLTTGDIITKFDNNPVTTMEDLQNLLQYYKKGTTVDVIIQRAGQGGYAEKKVSITLSGMEAQQSEDN